MTDQPKSCASETKEKEKPDAWDEIFSARALESLRNGPAADLWVAAWVKEGLARKKPAPDDTPAILKGWRKL